MRKVKRKSKKAHCTITDIAFVCLEKISSIGYEGKLPIMSRSGKRPEVQVKYACGHRMDDYMVVRCPQEFREDCKDLVNRESFLQTTMRDFILFDPRQSVFEKLKRVTDKCPECFFKPLLLKHPCCCSCGRPILVGDGVHLFTNRKKNILYLGVMRAQRGGETYLVRCMHGRCAKKRKRALLAWDGEKLVSYHDYVPLSQGSRHAA